MCLPAKFVVRLHCPLLQKSKRADGSYNIRLYTETKKKNEIPLVSTALWYCLKQCSMNCVIDLCWIRYRFDVGFQIWLIWQVACQQYFIHPAHYSLSCLSLHWSPVCCEILKQIQPKTAPSPVCAWHSTKQTAIWNHETKWTEFS